MEGEPMMFKSFMVEANGRMPKRTIDLSKLSKMLDTMGRVQPVGGYHVLSAFMVFNTFRLGLGTRVMGFKSDELPDRMEIFLLGGGELMTLMDDPDTLNPEPPKMLIRIFVVDDNLYDRGIISNAMSFSKEIIAERIGPMFAQRVMADENADIILPEWLVDETLQLQMMKGNK
jgi:hypothetical protein